MDGCLHLFMSICVCYMDMYMYGRMDEWMSTFMYVNLFMLYVYVCRILYLYICIYMNIYIHLCHPYKKHVTNILWAVAEAHIPITIFIKKIKKKLKNNKFSIP